ncbi:PAS domain-containing hybrid sensor histidine kinase/response regulator [Paludisphaera mucosa]|uniref:histidine kinase n=1 Tax=Paludisphaera mucosa TaxID=3030827 RepID=A0ABT6FL83_9BACT|nr:PAS domain S-box protein [Paludisphaera mucosa]MDG3008329.1 PAS domain S-box protein [Paludisphaera mucosa]
MLVEHSLDALATIEPDGRVSYVSPGIARVLGYTPEEFAELGAFDVVHPDERREAEARFSELLERPGGSQTAVIRVRHRDGAWRWIETVSTNQLDSAGVGVVVANFRDVTDRKRSEDAAREADEKFRHIVESATEFAIFTTDLEGRVDGWNSGAVRLLGYDEGEILGRDCRIFFTPEDNEADAARGEMHDALKRGSGDDERWHVRKDGSRFWGSGLMMPLKDDAGAVVGYLKIFRDMTREKRDAEALAEAARRKSEFLAILAHELRNPLAAIDNASQLLLVADGDDGRSRWCRDVIRRQAGRLARLLDDLLDVSRVAQGKIRLRKERLDLKRVVGGAVDVVRPLVDRKKHSLTIAMAPGEMAVFGDAARLEQVLVNLLTNAAKYTDDGGLISVMGTGGREVVVTVSDSGIGITPEMLPRVFELFAQVDRSIDRSDGGLGVGLTLSRWLVELHGGEISARSDGEGKGSEFVVRLPAAEANDVSQADADRGDTALPRRGLRLLVVEDNPDAALGLAMLLEASGHEVATAYDGPSAVELARSVRPDAVLSDIGLPGMDGYEVARRLRGDGAGALLIAISGYGQEEDRRRSREAGFDHHFIKPVDYESLSELLARLTPREVGA